jgi:2-polyprenyl-3-methyl-5-hydroxy-6-metoxy-1,4-benzoquinol methylase
VFIGRECYRYTEVLSQLLDEGTVRSRAISKSLQPLLKAYVYLFGVPDVGFQLRARYVRQIVKHLEYSSVMDAGCGIGLNALYLAGKCPSASVNACDLTPGLVRAAGLLRDSLKIKNLNVFEADLTRISDIAKYDLIICMDVIEHIQDDSLVLINISRALKAGGLLLLSTNHKRHIKRRLKGLDYSGGATHVRDGYNESELNTLFHNSGFEVIEIRNVWGFWGEYCQELYHWALLNLGSPVAALSFPVLSLLSSLDMLARNREGYGLMIIGKKENIR